MTFLRSSLQYYTNDELWHVVMVHTSYYFSEKEKHHTFTDKESAMLFIIRDRTNHCFEYLEDLEKD